MDIRTPISTHGGDWLAKFGESWKKQTDQLREKFGQQIVEVRMLPEYPTDVPIVYVDKESIVEVLKFLKEEPGFEYGFLADITATDEETEPRFEVVYNLFSHTHKWRIRLKVRVAEGEEVPTAVSVWKAANWAEREVYDMFGVRFRGHPDLRRILMDERWVGYPLRKDYPLRGYQVFTDAQPVHNSLLE
jgi:NADH-quinone oxidoreductase subunit C